MRRLQSIAMDKEAKVRAAMEKSTMIEELTAELSNLKERLGVE